MVIMQTWVEVQAYCNKVKRPIRYEPVVEIYHGCPRVVRYMVWT